MAMELEGASQNTVFFFIFIFSLNFIHLINSTKKKIIEQMPIYNYNETEFVCFFELYN